MPSQNKTKKEKAVGTSLGEVTKKLGVSTAPTAKEKKKTKKEEQLEARRKAAEKYEEFKEKVLKREQTNYSEIIVLRDKEKPGEVKKRWWAVYGHSANILKYDVGRTHGAVYRILDDDNYGAKSKEGMISVPNIENFLNTMRRWGYTEIDEGSECCVIHLEKRDVEWYQSLLDIDEELKRRLRSLIRPKEMLQNLNTTVKELDKKTHEMVRKMDTQSQMAYADEMERITIWLKVKLIRVARGSYPLGVYLEDATEKIEELWGYLAVVMDRRSFALEKIAEVGEAIRAVETQIDIERKTINKKRSKNDSSVETEEE